MERYMWRGRVAPSKLTEYIRRHDEIWQEMTEAIDATGVHNYSIWNSGDELFGYYECESVAKTKQLQMENEVFARWNEYMKDVLILEQDKDGKNSKMKQIFLHK